MIDYSIAGEYAQWIHALAIIESNENPLQVGDGGQAMGILQMHPATFRDYYPPALTDTWTQAQIRACAFFFAKYEYLDRTPQSPDLRVQAWNLGVHGILSGARNAEYLARFTQALTKVRSEDGRQH